MEKDPNSNFNEAFGGYTSNKKSFQKNEIITNDEKKYHATFLSTMLISHQCLFLALAVFDRAYFRDMLIFEPMLIFARVRYLHQVVIEPTFNLYFLLFL